MSSSGLSSSIITREEQKEQEAAPQSSSGSSSPAKEVEDQPLVAGSLDCPYRLLIVGGGPAGTSILVRAIHLDVINELCTFGATRDCKGCLKKEAGVCLVDSGASDRLGGGRLQDYIINSNTFGGKFVTNIVQDKLNLSPPEKATGTILESLSNSTMAQHLSKFGNDVAPLADIGKFLVEIGEKVKRVFGYYKESSKYESCCQVTQLQQSSCRQYWKVTYMNMKTQMASETYAYRVVLATGGSQSLPRLTPSSRNKKLMKSDDVCSQKGVEILNEKLGSKEKKKVVIIGGSHSAFSAAWVLLNKLDEAIRNDFQIYILHRTSIKVFYNNKKEADKDKYYDYDVVNKCGQIHPFGGLRGDAKALHRDVKCGRETRIRLLCTGPDGSNHQTMSNKLLEEAHVIVWACGYSANTSYRVLNGDGEVINLKYDRGQVEVNDLALVLRESSPNTFSKLYHSHDTTSISAVASAINNNAPLPVVTSLPNPTKSKTSPVSKHSVKVKDYPVGNLLGTGLGYGLSVSNNGSNESAKADGVAVYLKRGATLVLSHVLGPKVFGENSLSWEDHVADNIKRCNILALEAQVKERQLKQALNNNNNDSINNVNSSPKKLSRSANFDPSSPSNISTGNGTGFGFSPVKRSVSTAPTRTRVRSNCKTETVNATTNGTNIKREIKQAKLNNNVVKNCRKKLSSSSLDEKHQESNRTEEVTTPVNKLESQSSKKDDPCGGHTSDHEDDVIKGVSVLGKDEENSEDGIILPPVLSVQSPQRDVNSEQKPKEVAEQPASTQSQEETISRLCQPKIVHRKRHNPVKKSAIDIPKARVLSAKKVTEFVLDLPVEKISMAHCIHVNHIDKVTDANSHLGTSSAPITGKKFQSESKDHGSGGINNTKPSSTPEKAQQDIDQMRRTCRDGPCVADLLWAEKRDKSLSAANNMEVHSPNKSKSSPNCNRAKTSSGIARKLIKASKCKQYHDSKKQEYLTNKMRKGHCDNGDDNSVRSPVPHSAPMRSKRIVSRSVDGPPTSAILKLPSLCNGEERKPVLIVKHEVYNKSTNVKS